MQPDLASNATLNAMASSYDNGDEKATKGGGSGLPLYPGDFRIEQFTYNNSAVVGVIRDHLVDTNFLGVTVSLLGDIAKQIVNGFVPTETFLLTDVFV